MNWRNIKTKIIYCTNCGRTDHISKKCEEPITSYGLILLKLKQNEMNNIDMNSIKEFFIQKYKFPENQLERELKNICIKKYIQKNNFSNHNKDDIQKYINITINNIDYCLLKRRHTYNYIQFIKGLYDITEIDNIILMFKRMTYEEYNKIKNQSFKILWDEIWYEKSHKSEQIYEYNLSKFKYDFIKKYMMKILDNIKILYNDQEWGFPKGRKNDKEDNIECAIREFEEETGINKDNLIILNRLFPLIEETIGSNNKKYKMIYYLAILNDNKIEPKLDESNINQSYEIGDIKYLSYLEALNSIREYNIEKKEILEIILYFIMYNIRYYDKYYKKIKIDTINKINMVN